MTPLYKINSKNNFMTIKKLFPFTFIKRLIANTSQIQNQLFNNQFGKFKLLKSKTLKFNASKSPFYPNTSQTPVETFMTKQTDKSCVSLSYQKSVYDAVKLMTENNVGAVVVVSEPGRVVGIFTRRDFLKRVALKGGNPKKTSLRYVISENIGFVLPNQSFDVCAEFMMSMFVRHAPVVQFEGDSSYPIRTPHLLHLVGMVTVRDMVNKLYEMEKNKMRSGPDYPMTRVLDAYKIRMQKIGLRHTFNELKSTDYVIDALRIMERYNIGPILVKDNGKVVGIVTERDFCTKLPITDKISSNIKLGDLMTPNPVTIKHSATISACLKLFTEKGFRHIPVTNENGQCISIVSIRDLLQALYL